MKTFTLDFVMYFIHFEFIQKYRKKCILNSSLQFNLSLVGLVSDFSHDWNTKTCVWKVQSVNQYFFNIIPLSQGDTTAALRKMIKTCISGDKNRPDN